MLARLAAVALLDLVARRRHSRLSLGLVDETAHLLTASILVPDADAAVLAGSVALDADHVPDLAGIALLRSRGNRPVTHSLAGLTLLAAGAPRLGLSPSRAVLGASTHLLRDLATGTTAVPLLWPLSRRGYALPYAV